jgi:hypothetical protein
MQKIKGGVMENDYDIHILIMERSLWEGI